MYLLNFSVGYFAEADQSTQTRGNRSNTCALLPSSHRSGRRTLTAMTEKSEIRFLPLGARRLAYEVRGDGPPLVAPAWWVSHLELDWQSPDFRRFWDGVADGYTLIRYDRLGVGMSDRSVRDTDLTIDGEVASLTALLDELG